MVCKKFPSYLKEKSSLSFKVHTYPSKFHTSLLVNLSMIAYTSAVKTSQAVLGCLQKSNLCQKKVKVIKQMTKN